MVKHVIFLGAGASRASGYPVASDLRLLMSSEDHFLSWVKKCFPKDPGTTSHASTYFKNFAAAIKLFREGGFASVDDFCRLLSGRPNPIEVWHMRFLTRAVLGALNPEDKFEESEYYPFVQKLFKADLATLRDDVSILSFNYDPYLEFLLRRAWTARNRNALPSLDVGNSITSGFIDHHNCRWAESNQARLYLLKLHGSICEFTERSGVAKQLTTSFLFDESADERAKAIFDAANDHVPPIIFPWEILDESLKFKQQQNFPIQNDQDYYQLFVSIWERAQKEVLAADKISFVGLSMHEYLKLGFRYLFKGKQGRVEIVVANTLNERFREGFKIGMQLPPGSPCRRTLDLLQEVTDGRMEPAYSKRDAKPGGVITDNIGQRVTPRDSFEEFIAEEL